MKKHLIAVSVLVLLSFIMVREVLFTPGILAFDDLIPHLHANQTIDFVTQAWNNYYQWPEVRGRYSIFGTLFRYAPIIPLSLWFICTLAGVGVYFLSTFVQREVGVRNESTLAAIASGFFFMAILFSAKSHQFYSLFLGAALLPWLFVCFLNSIKAQSKWWLWALAGVGFLLINPAIHMVILGFGAITLMMLVSFIQHRWIGFKVWSVVAIFGLVPYGYWVWVSNQGIISAAMGSVPLNLNLVRSWSGPFFERILLPMGLSLPETHASPTGQYVFADQLFSRYPIETAFFGLFALLAVIALWRFRTHWLLLSFGLLWTITIMMGSGIHHSISFYSFFLALAEGEGVFASLINGLLAVLRNPYRWLLLGAMLLATLSGLGLTFLLSRFKQRWQDWSMAAGAVAVVMWLFPFVAHPAFQPVFYGDLGGVLRPMPLPNAYENALELVEQEKVLYLPIMGGARPLSWNNLKKTPDEAFALLHGGPSMEGSTGAPLPNQEYLGYLYFELLYEQKTTHLGRYLNFAGFRYLFFHDDVENPKPEDEFVKTRQALELQTDLELIFHQDNVYLYENLSWKPNEFTPLDGVIAFDGSLDSIQQLIDSDIDLNRVGLIRADEGDLDWQTFSNWVERLEQKVIAFSPSGRDQFLLNLLARSTGEVAYPLLERNENSLKWRDHAWLNVSVNNFSRFKQDYQRFGIDGAFNHRLVATSEGNLTQAFHFTIKDSGVYALFLRGMAAQGSHLSLRLDDVYETDLFFEPSTNYQFLPVEELFLSAGTHQIEIETLSNAPVILNMAYAIETSEWVAVQNVFESYQGLTLAKSIDELADAIERAETQEASSTLSLLGYRGKHYWQQRWLETNGQQARPWRNWMVGSLYVLDGRIPDNDLQLFIQRGEGQ